MATDRPAPPSDPQSGPRAHVRGAGAFTQGRTETLRGLSTFVDLAVALAIFFVGHRLLKLAPVPELWWIPAYVALASALWSGQKAIFGHTLGNRIWKLHAEHSGWKAPLFRPVALEFSEIAAAISLTLITVGASSWAVGEAVFRQPVWAEAESLELQAFLPTEKSWEVLPFYFSLGAWPSQYAGHPVFYSLPYEKAPPTRFVGHIIARWDAPDALVTFEGPKTPVATGPALKGERTPRERIKACLVGHEKSWSCLQIRETSLLRHLNDMQTRLAGTAGGSTALTMKWKLSWFTVKNPALSSTDQAQGIYLSAQAKNRREERYVLITENGTHQAILLDQASGNPTQAATADEALARRTFEQAIRSLRVSDELAPGRAWIDRELQSIDLGGGGPGAEQTTAVAKIAQAQAALIAKISVEPASFDAYFHLGGTAILLQRLAAASTPVAAVEFASVAKPLVQSAYRYAQDVGPTDPRTVQLQGFWLETQKR